MTLFSISLVLFLIMDPFGNVATFLNLLKKVDPISQKRIIFREMLIALAIMLAFNYFGKKVMDLLQVSAVTVRIGSGTILFIVALKILFPNINSLRVQLQNGLESDDTPFIVPLAIPLIAGPSLLATIILYTELESDPGIMLAAILISWLCSSIILFSSSYLQRILTNNGLIACERLMGMILILLAIQRFLEGIQLFAKSCQF